MRASLYIAALAMLALTTSCGKDEGERPVLRVADQKGSLQSLIEASAVLENAPFTVEWSSLPDSARVGEALAAGAVDTGSMAEAPFLVARASGLPIKAVQGIDTAGRGAGIAILVPRDSPARSFDDLRGKRIAATKSTTGHDLVSRLLEEHKWPATAVSIVYLAPADGKAALAAGSVDAWAVWDPFVATAELVDGARAVATAKGIVQGLDGFQVASEQAIADKRPLLQDFLQRLVRAERWGIAHPDEYAASWGKIVGLPPEVATLTVKRISRTPVAMDASAAARTQPSIARHLADGMLTKTVDLTTAFDSSFNKALDK